jgi:hypothetical protein
VIPGGCQGFERAPTDRAVLGDPAADAYPGRRDPALRDPRECRVRLFRRPTGQPRTSVLL